MPLMIAGVHLLWNDSRSFWWEYLTAQVSQLLLEVHLKPHSTVGRQEFVDCKVHSLKLICITQSRNLRDVCKKEQRLHRQDRLPACDMFCGLASNFGICIAKCFHTVGIFAIPPHKDLNDAAQSQDAATLYIRCHIITAQNRLAYEQNLLCDSRESNSEPIDGNDGFYH